MSEQQPRTIGAEQAPELRAPALLPKILAERALDETVVIHTDDAPDLKPHETLKLLHYAYGFYGHTSREVGSMYDIIARVQSAFPVLRYLDEVYTHQKYKTKSEHPEASLRSLVESFESHATEAHSEHGFSKIFENDVIAMHPDYTQPFAEAIRPEYVTTAGPMRRTLTSLTRQIETQAYVDSEGETSAPLNAKTSVDAQKDAARDARIYAALGDMPLAKVLDINKQYRNEQVDRFEYWRLVTDESRRNIKVRSQATRSLDKIDNLTRIARE